MKDTRYRIYKKKVLNKFGRIKNYSYIY